jgi:predicted dehydrogenase
MSENKLDRRNFLSQTATASAVAGLVMTQSARADDAASGESSANEQVVVGVMGCSRGKALASTFARQPNVKVKYVCDVDSNRAKSCADMLTSEFGVTAEATGEFRRILDDKDVDALICAAPNHWHGPATILGCAAGKHVYVEKPCSHNPREGELMIEAARKRKRAVQMGTQRRSSPGWIEAVALLHEGAIGRVYLSRSWYNNVRGSIGRGTAAAVPDYLNYDLWQGPAPRRDYLSNVVHYNWHWRWHWGNGELGNNGVHTIDLCRWGLGVDYPTRVTSSGGRYHFEDDQETPDTQTVNFDFDGRKSITWQGLSCNRHGDGFVTFYGDNGSMEVEAGGAYTIYDRNDKLVKKGGSNDGGEARHVANFVAAIRADKPLSLNQEIESGHKSTLLCHLGNIAQRTGRALDCDPASGHILNDKDAVHLWSREYEKGWEPVV